MADAAIDLGYDPDEYPVTTEVAEAPAPQSTPVPAQAPQRALEPGAPLGQGFDYRSQLPKPPTTFDAGDARSQNVPMPREQAGFDDEGQFVRSSQENKQKYLGTTREHTGEFRPIVDEPRFTLEQHPDYERLQQLRAMEKDPRFDTKMKRKYGGMIEAIDKRVHTDTANKNKEAARADLDARRADLRQQEQHDNVAQADATGSLLAGAINTWETKHEENLASADPKLRLQADFDSVVTPFKTMDKVRLREAAAEIARLNRLPSDVALDYTLKFGTPTGYDEETKQYEVGENGLRGKGGQYYDIIGHDLRGHAIVRSWNGRGLVIPTTTLKELTDARLQGYANSVQWRAKQDKLRQEPSFSDRAGAWVRGLVP